MRGLLATLCYHEPAVDPPSHKTSTSRRARSPDANLIPIMPLHTKRE
jgi:hypothetical protein